MGRDRPRYRPVHKSTFGSLVCCWVWSSSPGLYGFITPGHTPEAPHRSGTCGVRITSPPAVGERMLMPLSTSGNNVPGFNLSHKALALTRVCLVFNHLPLLLFLTFTNFILLMGTFFEINLFSCMTIFAFIYENIGNSKKLTK